MSNPGRDELEAALARFLDGEPEPRDGEILEAAMSATGTFALEVMHLLSLDDLLRQNGSPDDHAFVESLEMRLEAERGDSVFLDNLNRCLDRGEKGRAPRRPFFGRLVAAAVIGSVLFLGAVVGNHYRGTQPRQPQLGAVVQGNGEPAVQRPSSTVAVLTRVVNARWEGNDVAYEGATLSPGHLRLQSGLIQVEFITGASVIIEGPCDFEVLSAEKGFCHRGKLRTYVPPAAAGFTIGAPGVHAVDLGTEFSMWVDERGRGEIHVLDGKIELYSTGDSSSANNPKTLKAGGGAGFGPSDGLREIATDSTAVVDRSKLVELEDAHQRLRHQRWFDHSKSLRADPATVLYFVFEEDNTWERAVRNVANGPMPFH